MQKNIHLIVQEPLLKQMLKLALVKADYEPVFYDSFDQPEHDSNLMHSAIIDYTAIEKNDLLSDLIVFSEEFAHDRIPIIGLKDDFTNVPKEIEIHFSNFFNRNLSDINDLIQKLNEISSAFPYIERKITEIDTFDPGVNYIAHILLADDSKVVRNFVSNILKDRNYKVTVFENGVELLEYLRFDQSADIILLDNQMPVKDGISTLLELKHDEKLKDLPVLFLSAITEKEQVVKALQLGADDYIAKPFNIEEFFARLNVHLKIDQMKKELMVKNIKITEQRNQIQEKLEEIQTQAEKLANSNKIIEQKNKDITDSINYARRIQNAILPPDELFKSLLPNHFVLYKPRDIVSGDFYFLRQINNKIIIALADCTGHGVPGAFMNMLSFAFLNEIISKINDKQASDVLNELRDNIKSALRQTGKDSEAKDGLDIALCIFDPETKMIQYSGAYHSLIIIRDKFLDDPYPFARKTRNDRLVLSQIKGDKMPIGIFIKEHNFTNHTIQLMKGDMLYIFSDGFSDQPGGQNARKFMIRRFKEMLLKIYNEEPSGQKEILEKSMKDWTGNKYEQIDDILVIGIRI